MVKDALQAYDRIDILVNDAGINRGGEFRPKDLDPKIQAEMMSHIPMGRLGQLAELVGTVVYLPSEASNFAAVVHIWLTVAIQLGGAKVGIQSRHWQQGGH